MAKKPKSNKVAEVDGLSKKERKEVKKLIRAVQELKFHLPYEAGVAMKTTAVVVGCTDIAAGTTDSTRIGDKIRLSDKMMLRYYMHVDIGNDAAQQIILGRIILFQWHPATTSGGATEPAAADVLLNGPTGAVDIQSFYNVDKRPDYTILYDKVTKLVGPGTATTNAYNPSMVQYITKTISLKKARKNIHYVAASSTFANNHIYIMYLANVITDAQNPTLTWSAMLRWTDS